MIPSMPRFLAFSIYDYLLLALLTSWSQAVLAWIIGDPRPSPWEALILANIWSWLEHKSEIDPDQTTPGESLSPLNMSSEAEHIQTRKWRLCWYFLPIRPMFLSKLKRSTTVFSARISVLLPRINRLSRDHSEELQLQVFLRLMRPIGNHLLLDINLHHYLKDQTFR